MLKVYKYRIYPTKAQRRKIHQTLDSESAGRTFVKVNPAGTSQRCYRCGTSVPKDLSVRWHQCPICHLSIDRDVNSAKEILRLGHQSLEANLTMLPRSPHL